MDFLCVRLAWSNAPGSVALLLRPPFSSSCVRISHATPLESAAACVNEYASFQWCITPHLALRIRVCLSSNGNFTLFFADPPVYPRRCDHGDKAEACSALTRLQQETSAQPVEGVTCPSDTRPGDDVPRHDAPDVTSARGGMHFANGL